MKCVCAGVSLGFRECAVTFPLDCRYIVVSVPLACRQDCVALANNILAADNPRRWS
jgi:hypothetical protein